VRRTYHQEEDLMPLETITRTRNLTLSPAEERRLQRRLRALERRLAHHPDPVATLDFHGLEGARQVEVSFRLRLGPLGPHLVSHQTAATPDEAVRLAIDDIERQLERKHAFQRGEQAWGVPSRREPAELRPHPPTTELPPPVEEAIALEQQAEERLREAAELEAEAERKVKEAAELEEEAKRKLKEAAGRE